VRDEIDEVVKLLDVVGRCRRRRGEEDLSLRIVGEPLVVELLGVRPEGVEER